MNLSLEKLLVAADEVPEWVVLLWHDIVPFPQLKGGAVISLPVADVDEILLGSGCRLDALDYLALHISCCFFCLHQPRALSEEVKLTLNKRTGVPSYCPYLAHVLRAEAAPVGRAGGVVERGDPEPAVGVDARRVGGDLGEAAEHAVVLQHGLDEEGVGVAHHPQVTPATTSINPPQRKCECYRARARNASEASARGRAGRVVVVP